MDSVDEFMEGRRSDLAGRTEAILRALANDVNFETVGRELHRIVGTCGSYGLTEGSRGAAELLARVQDENVVDISGELIRLAELFALSARGDEN